MPNEALRWCDLKGMISGLPGLHSVIMGNTCSQVVMTNQCEFGTWSIMEFALRHLTICITLLSHV